MTFDLGGDSSSPLRGREAEIARLNDFLAVPGQDGHSVLLIVGDPGSGKSTLLDAAAQEAEALGMRILRCNGYEGEQSLDFAGVHQLLAPVLSEAKALSPPQRDAFPLLEGAGTQTVLGSNPSRSKMLRWTGRRPRTNDAMNRSGTGWSVPGSRSSPK